ncbi:MAG: hypothetical protein AAFR45_08070 [Pseudomonadota bacterium]
MTWLAALFGLRRGVVIALLIGGVLLSLVVARAWIRYDAQADLKSDMERKADAITRDAISADLDYRKCRDDGGVYAFDTGACQRPE